MLMQMGIPYGSKEALAITGSITAMMCGESYRTSAEMAKELGAFPNFAKKPRCDAASDSNHKAAALAKQSFEGLTIKPMVIDHSICPKELSDAAKQTWTEALELGEAFGFRNAQVTVIAPTGTIGLLMDCDTTGLSQILRWLSLKSWQVADISKLSTIRFRQHFKQLGYSPEQIKEMIAYCIGHGSLNCAPVINPENLKRKGFTDELIAKVNKDMATAFDISFVFTKWTLGEDFCKKTLKLSDAQLAAADLNILAKWL